MARTIYFRLSPLQVIIIVIVSFLGIYLLVPPLFRAVVGGRGGGGGGEEGFGASRGSIKHLKVVREKAMSWDEEGKGFLIGGKSTILVSGAIHYFRVPPSYWEDRLSKLAAAGLNTVETYMSWNLHEPRPGVFDFTGRLDVHRFVKMAQSYGLYVILRPGPYICAEWDFGGLPAWLLHDPDMVVRSTYAPYTEAVRGYMVKVGEVLGELQYTYGGPIIAVQLENEYASYEDGRTVDSRNYMKFIFDLFKSVGFKEQLFTSDGQDTLESAVRLRPHEEVLLTVNYMHDRNALEQLEELQPHRPKMVMEFWSGWFDHWGEGHVTRKHPAEEIESQTTDMLNRGISVNYYMFHGGTNFGFMNGANWGGDQNSYNPTITSYDYDAPLAENGDVTAKYRAIRKAVLKHKPPPSPSPIPPNILSTGYGDVKLTLYLSILSTLQYLPEPHISRRPVPMELLPLHGCGQGYGFVLYRTTIPSNSTTVTVNQVRDYGIAMVEGVPVQTMSLFESQTFLISPSVNIQSEGKDGIQLDLLVENAGRVNFGHPLENRKGILGKVLLGDTEVTDWKIYSLEFEPEFIQQISEGGMWQRTPPSMPSPGPALYKGSFTIEGEPKDTFIDMKGWGKGVLFINEANLGRYWKKGPQGTLYVPAPVLRRGVNQVVLFETRVPKKPQIVTFKVRPILDVDAE